MNSPSIAPSGPLERRQLTVLECDLVGSSSLAGRMDEEEFATLLISFQECVSRLMRRFDGYVFQFVGDAVWVYFGYPHAREDAAQRAIGASLAVIEALDELDRGEKALRCRISIATGLCIIGTLVDEDGSRSADAASGIGHRVASFGDTLNLVAHLKSIADPQTIVVADETRSLAGSGFKFLDLRSHRLKGQARPVRAWRVLGETRGRSRLETLRPAPTTPLVGRDAEVSVLETSWHRARERRRQVVDVYGDAGIGKSRLVAYAISERLAEAGAGAWWFHCSPQRSNSAFAPIIDYLLDTAGIGLNDSPTAVIEKIRKRFSELDADAISLLAPLLSINTTALASRTGSLSPIRRRERLFDVLIDLIETECRRAPLLIISEDVHWADPSTHEFLRRLAERSTDWPLLLLVTSRTERDAGVYGEAAVRLRLGPLAPMDSLALIRFLSATHAMPDTLSRRIAERTDGVPLFIEDVTQGVLLMLANAGTDAPAAADVARSVAVPLVLRNHLMARVDGLGAARRTAQAAAVIGREFSRSMLASVVSASDESLDAHLDEMLDSGLIERRDEPGGDEFAFKHALVRDAAYESMLKADRVLLHGRLAEWIESSRPEYAVSRPEILASHHERAGHLVSAISSWLEAGRRSVRQAGYVEATTQLQRAYALLGDLEASPARDRIELEIISALGAAHAGAGAFSSEDTGRAYERALQLCEALGHPPDTLPVLSGACAYHFMRANFARSRDIAGECLRRFEDDPDSTGGVIGHRAIGAVSLVVGQFDDAIELLGRAVELYDRDPVRHRGLPSANALDHKTTALCFLALATMTVGRLDDALDASDAAIAHSRGVDQHSVNYALCYRGALHHLRGDGANVIVEVATESLELALSEGYATWVGISRLCLGEAMMRRGQLDEGLTQIEDGVAAHANVMAVTFLPFAQSVLAKGYLLAGRPDEAEARLVEAVSLSRESRQHWLLPELERLLAAVADVRGERDHAMAGLERAVSTSSAAGARLWQAKAELDLAALLRRSGRSNEAQSLIEHATGCLSGGADAPIVAAAIALSQLIRAGHGD